MINYTAIEDVCLFGLEESINNGEEVNSDCWFKNEEGECIGQWQGEEVAVQLYAQMMGWA